MVGKHSLIVFDSFYSNPDRIRGIALDLKREEINNDYPSYDNPFARRTLRKIVGRPITKWNATQFGQSEQGYFTFRSSLRGHGLYIHQDTCVPEFVALVYLTPNIPFDKGTSFWRHKKTGLYAHPTPSDAKRLGISVRKLAAVVLEDSHDVNKWDKIGEVGNVYNRCVIFRSARFHSVSGEYGSNFANSRLTQTWCFSTQ